MEEKAVSIYKDRNGDKFIWEEFDNPELINYADSSCAGTTNKLK